MSSPQMTLLITVTGRDRPGVTSRLFSVLAAHELSVLDVAQVVIRGSLHVTVLGRPLAPAAIAGIAGRIAASGANIDRISRLAHRPVTCIEFDISGADPAVLRADLARESVA